MGQQVDGQWILGPGLNTWASCIMAHNLIFSTLGLIRRGIGFDLVLFIIAKNMLTMS